MPNTLQKAVAQPTQLLVMQQLFLSSEVFIEKYLPHWTNPP